jgi:hypothetical protein
MGLIELTGFGNLSRKVRTLFWGLVIGALAMALTLPKTRRGKVTATLIVVCLFGALPGRSAWEAKQQRDTYPKAEALFQERCRKSGEFIYRTAENVEGCFCSRCGDRLGLKFSRAKNKRDWKF